MAKFNFRILLESVEGVKTSYISQSFVDTSVDLVLSASQVYNRITQHSGSGEAWELAATYTGSAGMVSCSYLNQEKFKGTINRNFTFKQNTLLSASLTESSDTGRIKFTSLNTEYDRLLRYKFFGEKVCNVLGLPNSQWVYVDQVRLPADDENNFLQGNLQSQNIFVSDTMTFAGTSNVNSDIPFLIDTGSDRYVKFVDTRGTPSVALKLGYNQDTDRFELSGSTASNFTIGGVKSLSVSQFTASRITSSVVFADGSNIFGDALGDQHTFNGSISASGNISASGDIILNSDKSSRVIYKAHEPLTGGESNSVNIQSTLGKLFISSGSTSNATTTMTLELKTQEVGINTTSPAASLDIVGNLRASSHITSSGNISSSGNIIADGIKATLPAGVDNSVVILDADGFLKTDEADGKIFTGVLGPDGSTTFGSSNNNKIPYISDGDNNLLDTSNLTHNVGGVSVTGHITASGNISSSLASTASFGHIMKGGVNFDTAVSSSAVAAGFGSGGGSGTTTAALTAGDGLNNGGGTFNGSTARTFSVDSASFAPFYSASMNDFTTAGTGSFGTVTTTGNISSSGTGTNFFAGNINFDGDTTISTVGGSDDITINPDAELNLGTGNVDEINIGRQSGTCDINMFANTSTVAARFVTSTITFGHPITASSNLEVVGNISGSSTSTINVGGNITTLGTLSAEQITSTDDMTVTDDLTVGGQMSASGKVIGDDFEFNLPTDNGRKFKGLTNRGVRIEKASTGGWAMEYGFVGNTEIDLGGFGGLGGAGLTRFYIGGHYTTPIISIQSGSANTNGMIIGDNVKATLPAATLHISGGLFLDGGGAAGGHITASGNISSSGTITAATLDAAAVSDGLAAVIVAEIDNDEIPIAKLAEDAITIAGTSTALGGSITSKAILVDGKDTVSGSITAVSSSLASRTTTLEGNVGQAVNTDSNVQFNHITASGNISASGNILTSGNITSLGTITAEQITSTDDITASGNISSSGTITGLSGSFGSVAGTLSTAAQPNVTSLGTLTSLNVDGAITATGNISSSVTSTGSFGRIIADSLFGGGNVTFNGVTTLNDLTMTGLANQGSEATAVVINGSNVVGTRELGSNAFTSTTIGTTTAALTAGDGLTSAGTFTGATARTFSVDSASMGGFYSGSMNSFTTTGTGSFGQVTVAGQISGSSTSTIKVGGDITTLGDIIASQGLISMDANNQNGILINNVDGEEQYAFFVDSNQHSDLLIYKDGTNKVRFNTYWPGSIQNDNYATRGALVLGTDLGTPSQAASNNRYGIYVSGGPDSGSAYFDENVKIGGSPGVAPTERLEIHSGGRIKVTPGSDTTGSILSLAGDHDVLFSSQNDSPTGDPQQFVLQHNDGHTELVNRRGNLILSSSADITIGAPGKDITLTDGDGTAEFIFNLEDAPELDVDGDFTIDGSGLIKLDSATNIVDLVGNVTASGNLEVAGQISGSSTSTIEVGGAITASGGILLGSGKSISDADAPASYYLDPSGNSRVNNLTTVGPTTTIGGDLSVTSGTGSFEYIQTSKNISASGNFHTLGGVVNTDEVRSITQTTNKLILEDDQSLATNMVSLMSVNHVNIISDGNNNGTGKVRILDGNYDVDSTTEVAEFSPEAIELHAPITASGNLEVAGNISGSLTSTGSFGSLVVSDKVQGNLTIDGTLFATKKSFLVNRPQGGKLEYGVLEGLQHDVFFRGELKSDNVIYLPLEWEWLVDENTITTQLTSIGKHQELFVKEIKDNKIFIDINGVFKTKENIHCYYIVHGTRKDVERIKNLK